MTPRGRYLATTLALLAVALGYGLFQGWPERPRARPSPPGVAVRPGPPPAPATAREILDRREALALTRDQVARLEALDGRWRQEGAPLGAALEAEAAAVARFMEEARSARGATVQEIQRRSAGLSELSALVRAERRRHAAAAASVLTEGQRQRLVAGTPTTPGGGR